MNKIRSRGLHFALVLAIIASLLPLRANLALAAGTVSLTAFGSVYTQDFNTLASSGTTNTAVPTGWEFSESGTNANTTYRAGTGSDTAGDTYSFGASGNAERAFGGLRSGSLVPLIGAQFTNNTGGTIGSLDITYTGEQWRLGQNTTGRAADRLDFQLSTSATSLTTGTWTDFNALDFSSPVVAGTVGALDGNAASNRNTLTFTIPGLSIPHGASFWLRWADTDLIPGADDGLSVDDFSLTPSGDVVDSAPSVSGTNPTNGSSNVPLTSDVTVTFSEAVSVTGGWFQISCTASGARDISNALVSGGPTTFTINPNDNFANNETCTTTIFAAQVTDQDGNDPPDSMAADFVFSFSTPNQVLIREIQGANHISPINGQSVKTAGVVTALRTEGSTRGFYLQDPNPDSDPATSEGIFVFTGSSSNPAALVSVGDSVEVNGTVSEFRQGGSASANLTLTELVAPFTINLLSHGNVLPDPVLIGNGGRIPPSTVIENDAVGGSVENAGSAFDPASDGLDFYESLEGMLVQVNDAIATGPTSDFGSNREISVIADNGANASARTTRGGVIIQPGDFNPERVILNDWIVNTDPLPMVHTGASFTGATVGVMDYSFGNFKLQYITLPAVTASPITREVTQVGGGKYELNVATFNVENLSPVDPQAKFDTLAGLIVNNLQGPDVLAIEEIQDNNGPTNDSVVAADQTWGRLITAISSAGGPTYDFRSVNPVDDQDGGQPGGNIRVGFLFRTDRGLTFVDRPGATATTANSVVAGSGGPELLYSPGRIDPTNAAFSTSRKPLAGEFDFFGHRLFLVANHFNSKGGDQPLFGRFQPPALITETQRQQQATVVKNFVQSILSIDPGANVVVLGDLNDFHFSTPLTILESAPLHTLIESLPLAEQYTYVFEGNSQALDHTLVSSALFNNRPFVYDVVHVNSEFADQASDHEPQVTHVTINDAPSASAGGPYSVAEGSSVTLSASGSDPENGTLSYAWDLDNNGSFETSGQSVSYTGADGPSANTVRVRVTDDGGRTAVSAAVVNVTNVAPAITNLALPVDPVKVNTAVTGNVDFADPGLPDIHTLTVNWGDGSAADTSTLTVGARAASINHTYGAPGVYEVTVTITDDDGGSDSQVYDYVVIYDPAGSFVTGGGWINSPAGAYPSDPTLTGKATFGFFSKYQKGSTIPTGATEFCFQAANLEFQSTAYEWLVVSGSKGQIKGTGTINGAGNYGFLLTAVDGSPDRLRVKIWDKVTDVVVYDNQLGLPDNTTLPPTALGGGSITIHK